MNPVWVEFPDIPWGSIGWRMGHGEEYMRTWGNWFLALPLGERAIYRNQNPEPEGWAGFFDFIEHRTLPHWMKERQRKLEEPQTPPMDEENEIADYYRISWLMRHYLKGLPYPDVPSREQQMGEAEYSIDFFVDPRGAKWRVAGLKVGGFNMTRVRDDV
jgi:hypothetical protein